MDCMYCSRPFCLPRRWRVNTLWLLELVAFILVADTDRFDAAMRISTA